MHNALCLLESPLGGRCSKPLNHDGDHLIRSHDWLYEIPADTASGELPDSVTVTEELSLSEIRARWPHLAARLGQRDKLQAAISALGAVEVEAPDESEGFANTELFDQPRPVRKLYAVKVGSRYMLFTEGAIRFTVSRCGYAKLTHLLDDHRVEMPAWWTPERRFAWRIKTTGEVVPTMYDARNRFEGSFDKDWVERITADLESGEEVPA